jgi:hypothetical protein
MTNARWDPIEGRRGEGIAGWRVNEGGRRVGGNVVVATRLLLMDVKDAEDVGEVWLLLTNEVDTSDISLAWALPPGLACGEYRPP